MGGVCAESKVAKLKGCISENKYTILRITMLMLFVPLAFSIMRTFGWTGSAAGLLAKWMPQIYAGMRQMISIEAVEKLGDAVGICSIVAAWIYTALDKTELGFRYSELLQEICPGYQYLFLMHMAAFVVCLWSAMIGKLESALWAGAIVFVGNIIQLNSLNDLILHAERRISGAANRWRRLAQVRDGKELKVIIYNMSGALCYDVRGSHQDMEGILADAIGRYIKEQNNNWKDTLRELADIWSCLLGERPASEQKLVVTGVLRACATNACMPMCMSYFVWYHNTYMTQVDSKDKVNAAIEEIMGQGDYFGQRFGGGSKSDIARYANVAVFSLCWMYFCCGQAAIISGSVWAQKENLSDEEEQILDSWIRILFTAESVERYWGQAKAHFMKSRTESTVAV